MTASVINVRMNQVLRQMIDAGALSPETARSAAALGLGPNLTHKRALLYLRRRGALVETQPGIYYVDIDAVHRTRKLQLTIIGIALVAALVILLIGILMGGTQA